MPALKAKHVVSFSSEDPAHPADNILQAETYYKWRCVSGGEPNAAIILQLEKACQINAVDIGNNGSAFIEVLVGRSSWSASGEEFKVLLAASSFMTPNDSKAQKEIYRVRMFTSEHLNKSVTSEKWDQVKIVCTQPYNQTEPYGLSFVKLYTPTVNDEATEKPAAVTNLGRFKLKCDSDDDTPVLSTGSFFQKRMNIPGSSPATPKMSTAALARSNEPSPRTPIFQSKTKEPTCTNMISISSDKRQEVASALFQGSEKPDKKGSVLPEGSLWASPKLFSSKETRKPGGDTVKLKVSKQTGESTIKRKIDADDNTVYNSLSVPPPKKLKDTKHPKVKKKLPYHKVMSGVVFVISGYQNPERSNIRDLAISMGARYEPGWNDRCTHLICAFANTPKFREVRGKGKIVKKKWIDDCDNWKRRLNTKAYRLDGGGDSSYESTDSEDGTENTIAVSQEEKSKKSSSECDTEGEIEKIRMLEKEEKLKNSVVGSEKIQIAEETKVVSENMETSSKLEDKEESDYGATTDDDNIDVSNAQETKTNLDPTPANKHSLPPPDFFKEKLFFLYGDFDVKDSRLIKRHITTYAGSISDYMSDLVDFVISEESWDHHFQQAFDDNNAIVFVCSKWVFKCHEKQTFLPYEPYEIKAS